VGSHCCKAFAQTGWNVVAFDDLSRGWRDRVKWGPLIEVHCHPTLDHAGLEFSAFPRSDGLVSPAEFASMIGGIFPIALCGR
jgi:nucleoside-diphosphate-sugar epimerase